jgi:hypothetical protein
MNPVSQQNACSLLPSTRKPVVSKTPLETRTDNIIKEKLHYNTVSERGIKKHPNVDKVKNTANIALIHQSNDTMKIAIPEKPPTYCGQIILNFLNDATAKGLTNRAKRKMPNMPSKTIPLNNPIVSSKEMDTLEKYMKWLLPEMKIYIAGHCSQGSNYIISDVSSDMYSVTSVKKFVKWLKLSPDIKKTGDGQKITISLIACHAATYGPDGACFASRLSQKLALEGISANVIARRADIAGDPSVRKPYKVLPHGRNHHNDLYKFSYTSEKIAEHTVATTVKVFDYVKKTWGVVENEVRRYDS